MAIKISNAFLTKLQMTNDGSYNEIQDLTGTAAIISASAEGGGSSDIPSGWSATTSSVDNSSPVGSAVTGQKHYRLESLDDGQGTTTHLGSEAPYNGFADSVDDILQYQGNNYKSVSNSLIYTDQSSLIVGAFIADFQGTFINSNDTHNTTYEQEYAYWNTPKYAAIKTNSLRSSPQPAGHTVNEDTIIKVEQYNGYLRITQILTINS